MDSIIYDFERVNQFEYLGVTVTSNNEDNKEIEKRINKGSKAMGSLNKM